MHPARWKLTLIACAAASVAAQAQVTAPSDAGALPAAPATEESSSPEREWRLPPLRFSGNIAYDMRALRAKGENSLSNVVTGTIGTGTYIYQPWFATVTGTVGLSASHTSTSAPVSVVPFSSTEVHDRMNTQERFVTGNARVDLFPRSRFPAEIHFDRQDSRIDSGLASPIEFQRQNIGLSMRYRPDGGAYSVVGAYDHRSQTGSGLRSTQDSLSSDFSTRWKFNDLALGASFNRARSEGFDNDSRFTSLVARHAYTPSNALSLNSTANITRTEEGGAGQSDLQVLQANSVGVYHPDRAPYTVTASLRGLVLRDRNFDAATDSLGGTLGINYEVNPNFRVSGNAGATGTHTTVGNSTFGNAGVAATYQGDALEFRKIRYDWFASGSAAGSIGSTSNGSTASDRNLGLQLGHSANRTWPLSPRSNIGLSASQSLATTYAQSSREEDSGQGSSVAKSLLNTVALSWQQSGDGKSGYARASYSDSMELGGGHSRFQLFNFQVSGNFELGYGRSISADLTYQRSVQRVADLVGTGDALAAGGPRSRSAGAAGEITFRQNNVFGVPRLRFQSRLRLAQDVLKQPGQLQSIPDRETRLWENRLDWSIGRLETQLELRMSQIDGRRFDSLWVRVQRSFGN
jgi:hypothetical protein